jgi:hypothetical protein
MPIRSTRTCPYLFLAECFDIADAACATRQIARNKSTSIAFISEPQDICRFLGGIKGLLAHANRCHLFCKHEPVKIGICNYRSPSFSPGLFPALPAMRLRSRLRPPHPGISISPLSMRPLRNAAITSSIEPQIWGIIRTPAEERAACWV